MPASLTLTFAELGFILALRTPQSAALGGDLSRPDGWITPTVARAGLASLLARGLCEATEGTETTEATGPVGSADGGTGANGARRADGPGKTATGLRFDPETSVLLRALADPGCVTTVAAAWCGQEGSLVHLVDGDGARMALFPTRLGCYTAEALPATEPLSALLGRIATRHLADGSRSALVARSVRGERSVAIALALDADGQWLASDSVANPHHAIPVTRERAFGRLTELFDGLAGGGAGDSAGADGATGASAGADVVAGADAVGAGPAVAGPQGDRR